MGLHGLLLTTVTDRNDFIPVRSTISLYPLTDPASAAFGGPSGPFRMIAAASFIHARTSSCPRLPLMSQHGPKCHVSTFVFCLDNYYRATNEITFLLGVSERAISLISCRRYAVTVKTVGPIYFNILCRPCVGSM
jgi:hypothetical protein